MKKTTRLKQLLNDKQLLVAPGAYDALSAKIIEAAGFNAVYMTGYGTSASVLGEPDVGLLSFSEMAQRAGDLANAVNVPVLADADTCQCRLNFPHNRRSKFPQMVDAVIGHET